MKGAYILVINVQKIVETIIGALGKIRFNKGYYLYIGSAMANSGATTLVNRVKRHLSSSEYKKVHWHIDYLLNYKDSTICFVYLIPSLQNLECFIAKELLNVSDGYINNFGSSDCKCKSHLPYFKNFKPLDKIFQ
jgi:Uri superfamily endonuclease